MTDTDAFTIRRVATARRDPNGTVIAWAATEPWALLIAGLLNWVEAEGVESLSGAAGEGDATRRKTRLGPQVDPR